MGIFDTFLDRQIQKRLPQYMDLTTQKVTEAVVSHVDASLEKAQASAFPGMAPTGLKRYEFNTDMVNGNVQSRKKPGSNISFETLRRFSVSHEVSRACINLRKRQITGLEWEIVSADKDDNTLSDSRAAEVRQFFKTVGGRGNGYRKFIDKFIEDLMVLDAVALEKQRNKGGGLFTLIPIDASTIRVKVDDTGAIPEPPDPAYVQIIRGQTTAELTADEMIYTYMNPRNDSPYGLSPLESLMIIVTSSLKLGMYNLAYLTDTNIPEGFFTMPETWQPQQIKDFQEYFDALMAGDETMTRRLKFMPQGAYTPAMKPTDMAFQEFNDWLMKITCALFEVSPMEIGFSPKTGLGGKGFSEEQAQTAEKKGVAPLANFIEELFTSIIQEDLGYPDLKFQYTGLIEHDEKSTAEVNEILIRSGQRTVNELRTDDGLDPIEGLDKPFFAGQVTFLDEESQNAQQNAAAALSSQLQGDASGDKEQQPADAPDGKAEAQDEAPESKAKSDSRQRHVELVSELRTFRKYALARIKSGKSLRKFESSVLPEETVSEINLRLQKAKDTDEAKAIFREFMDDYQVNFVADVIKLQDNLSKILG